jgi:hypothetical protein
MDLGKNIKLHGGSSEIINEIKIDAVNKIGWNLYKTSYHPFRLTGLTLNISFAIYSNEDWQ